MSGQNDPSWVSDHALRPLGQAGWGRALERNPQRDTPGGHTLSPALLAVWFRGQAGPEGLRLCELLSVQSPLLLSLWSVLLPGPSFPWTPSPSLGRWSGVGPMRRDAGQGWLGWQAGGQCGW